MPQSRGHAERTVRDFIAIVQDQAMCGSGHPDLREWHDQMLAAATERVVRKLCDDPRPVRLPVQPEIDYDR